MAGRDYSQYIGKEVNGYLIIRVIPKEEYPSYGISLNCSNTMLLCSNGCPKCGPQPRQSHVVFSGRNKFSCHHFASADLAKRAKDKYKAENMDSAIAIIGTTIGAWYVQRLVPKKELPFTPKDVRAYVQCICTECGRATIIDSQNIANAKCSCAYSPQGGLTGQYPRLYAKLKKHFNACYVPATNSYQCYGAKGWRFDDTWIFYKDGKVQLNTKQAILDCIGLGWDESNTELILEKDKLAIELGERVIGPQTVRFTLRAENSLWHFDDEVGEEEGSC